ncbi:metallophosphoesterase [Seonamhaeicola aphaedonensis]|uniref:Calcineurin-like phosphoesterase family protein n=1 Tax=Seonamhaeicola aphaedonensis TaxID=1461338 RepID=A0A3D9H8D5_9FLAO|nr:metallophosphoesterase [Seonamhaeicola aphaedonensis]RED45743.1 calcineurin-like phosphoesterase family protein [Seonamhaeicola aphaedonensis]
MTTHLKYFLVFVIIIIINACATYKPQYKDVEVLGNIQEDAIAHSFYLIGDAGNSPMGTKSNALLAFEKELKKAPAQSTVIFLGDNIYPKGMPEKGHKGRAFAEHQLKVQTEVVKDFKGHAIFIPGNHDWYSNGLEGLMRQEKYVEDKLGKNTFLPENGCPLEKVKISEDILLLIVDSEWYLTNWNKHPTMNDDCDIKTRTKFFDELEGEIKKARGKTTIIAVHHPMFTNGSHGGQYSFGSHMSPVPVLGTIKNIVREAGGVTTVDTENSRYNEFRKRLITLAQENDKTIFVSGHDHNLQYIVQDNLPQIVSGSGSKITATRNVGGGRFSHGTPGYARLDILKDGSSFVRFYSSKDDKIVYQKQVFPKDKKHQGVNYPNQFPLKKEASVYTKDETEKGRLYKLFWGDRYREDFSTIVKVPTVSLDTLLGGLTPLRKGGGHQSKSLRLEDKKGREYVMRALRKNAVQYLQAVAFKDQYIEGQFNKTYTEALLLDVFTGSHPYAPFTIGVLSDAVGVFHTNPVLYYVPKQNALGQFNEDFGNELYMIEERAADGHGDKKSFGYSDELISTDDLLKQLHKDEDIVLDERAYIRARLFDMLIGDWDRHEDQWRWAKFKENGKTVYLPVPRDRDQAFSIMADGALLGFATRVVPTLRLMQSYEEELKSPKWFNLEPYPLDMALINISDKSVWDEEVNHIVTNLTNEVIDKSFAFFPPEVNQNTIQTIKQKLIGRRANLQGISNSYYNHINKFSVIKGTNKDDWFDIERLPNGKTKVIAYRIKGGEKTDVFHKRTYSHDYTKEIWIYGLDDDDVFKVFGSGDELIKVRIIGGQNNDTYMVDNKVKLKVYDHKSKPNTFTNRGFNKKLTDDYETNVYDHKKLKNSSNQLMPAIGANPDDGLKIGFNNTFTNYGFERNPFTAQHTFSGAYYFATNGFELGYNAEFANVFGHWNLLIDTQFTSPNYAVNFFGFGNTSPNPEADKNDGFDANLDYNRVKLQTLKLAPSLIWRGDLGAIFKIGLKYESIEVEETQDRFINQFTNSSNIDISNDFLGFEMDYEYSNSDNSAFPTMGMFLNVKIGYVNNLSNSNRFGYLIPELSIDHKIDTAGQLVFATKSRGHLNFGDAFEFYQAANIGAKNGLRGYRNERFSGKSAFVQTSDLRFNLRKLKTGLLPMNIGVYGGFDIGKVWVDDELVLMPEHNLDDWNTSIGGGVFANLTEMATLNLSAFHSDDGLRLAFKMGFGF